MTLTQAEVKRLFDYDPETGVVTRRVNVSNVKAGDVVGTFNKTSGGYLAVKINRKFHLLHRIIWLWVYGEFPPDQIDHINHDKTDNRLHNLRAVSHKENGKNQPIRSNNTSGFIGIRFANYKWQARIRVNYKQIHLGVFENIEDAIAARKAAEIEYGFHENHGALR